MIKEVSKYKLPSGWTLAIIDDLIGPEGLFMDGDWIESKDQNTNGEVRLIQLADIGDGYFRNRSNRYMTLESANELNCTFLKSDDILVARMPDPLGRCTIFPIKDGEKYVTVVDVAIIRTGEKGVHSKYLMYFINSPVLRKKIELLQTGTTRKRISRGNLGKLKIPVPPLNEQYRIVSKIEELLSELEHAEDSLKKSHKQLEIYRQSILKSAFDGSLTLKKNKTNTTPVDVLIKQIAEERQAQYDKLNSLWLNEIKKWEKKEKKTKRPSKPEKPVYPSEITSKELVSLPKLSTQWKWIKIGYVDELTSAGSTPKGGKNIYSKSGIAFIRSQNVYPGKLLTDDLVYISKEIHTQMNRTHIKVSNYRLCGSVGNSKKKDHFAVKYNKVTAPGPIKDEVIYFLDPTSKEDVKLLNFDNEGKAIPSAIKDDAKWNYERADYTIDKLDLNYPDLVEERKMKWQTITALIKKVNELDKKYNDEPTNDHKGKLEAKKDEIRKMLNPCEELTATTKACLRSSGQDWAYKILEEQIRDEHCN